MRLPCCGGFESSSKLIPPRHTELSREELRDLYEKSVAANGGRLIVHGILARADTKNNNKRVYPKRILKREAARYLKEHVRKGTALGELDHPSYSSKFFKCLNLPNISHQVLDMWWVRDCLWGTLEVLPTPSGLMLWELYSQGVRLGVSSRGWASLRTDPTTKCVYVDDDYELITFDFVNAPSTRDAYLVPVMVKYRGVAASQGRCVQLSHVGYGVVAMRKIQHLPSAGAVLERVEQIREGAQGKMMKLNPLLGAHPLDNLLLFGHYCAHPQEQFLQREEHIRDLCQHIYSFAIRAYLAMQAVSPAPNALPSVVQMTQTTSKAPAMKVETPATPASSALLRVEVDTTAPTPATDPAYPPEDLTRPPPFPQPVDPLRHPTPPTSTTQLSHPSSIPSMLQTEPAVRTPSFVPSRDTIPTPTTSSRPPTLPAAQSLDHATLPAARSLAHGSVARSPDMEVSCHVVDSAAPDESAPVSTGPSVAVAGVSRGESLSSSRGKVKLLDSRVGSVGEQPDGAGLKGLSVRTGEQGGSSRCVSREESTAWSLCGDQRDGSSDRLLSMTDGCHPNWSMNTGISAAVAASADASAHDPLSRSWSHHTSTTSRPSFPENPAQLAMLFSDNMHHPDDCSTQSTIPSSKPENFRAAIKDILEPNGHDQAMKGSLHKPGALCDIDSMPDTAIPSPRRLMAEFGTDHPVHSMSKQLSAMSKKLTSNGDRVGAVGGLLQSQLAASCADRMWDVERQEEDDTRFGHMQRDVRVGLNADHFVTGMLPNAISSPSERRTQGAVCSEPAVRGLEPAGGGERGRERVGGEKEGRNVVLMSALAQQGRGVADEGNESSSRVQHRSRTFSSPFSSPFSSSTSNPAPLTALSSATSRVHWTWFEPGTTTSDSQQHAEPASGTGVPCTTKDSSTMQSVFANRTGRDSEACFSGSTVDSGRFVNSGLCNDFNDSQDGTVPSCSRGSHINQAHPVFPNSHVSTYCDREYAQRSTSAQEEGGGGNHASCTTARPHQSYAAQAVPVPSTEGLPSTSVFNLLNSKRSHAQSHSQTQTRTLNQTQTQAHPLTEAHPLTGPTPHQHGSFQHSSSPVSSGEGYGAQSQTQSRTQAQTQAHPFTGPTPHQHGSFQHSSLPVSSGEGHGPSRTTAPTPSSQLHQPTPAFPPSRHPVPTSSPTLSSIHRSVSDMPSVSSITRGDTTVSCTRSHSYDHHEARAACNFPAPSAPSSSSNTTPYSLYAQPNSIPAPSVLRAAEWRPSYSLHSDCEVPLPPCIPTISKPTSPVLPHQTGNPLSQHSDSISGTWTHTSQHPHDPVQQVSKAPLIESTAIPENFQYTIVPSVSPSSSGVQYVPGRFSAQSSNPSHLHLSAREQCAPPVSHTKVQGSNPAAAVWRHYAPVAGAADTSHPQPHLSQPSSTHQGQTVWRHHNGTMPSGNMSSQPAADVSSQPTADACEADRDIIHSVASQLLQALLSTGRGTVSSSHCSDTSSSSSSSVLHRDCSGVRYASDGMKGVSEGVGQGMGDGRQCTASSHDASSAFDMYGSGSVQLTLNSSGSGSCGWLPNDTDARVHVVCTSGTVGPLSEAQSGELFPLDVPTAAPLSPVGVCSPTQAQLLSPQPTSPPMQKTLSSGAGSTSNLTAQLSNPSATDLPELENIRRLLQLYVHRYRQYHALIAQQLNRQGRLVSLL